MTAISFVFLCLIIHLLAKRMSVLTISPESLEITFFISWSSRRSKKATRIIDSPASRRSKKATRIIDSPANRLIYQGH